MLFKGIKLLPIKKPRGFNYEPRYSKEGDEKKNNIHFRRMYTPSSKSRRSLLYLILLAIIVIYLIIYFKGITEKSGTRFKVEDVKIEEVEE